MKNYGWRSIAVSFIIPVIIIGTMWFILPGTILKYSFTVLSIWYPILIISGYWSFKNVQVNFANVKIFNYFDRSKSIVIECDKIENLYIKGAGKSILTEILIYSTDGELFKTSLLLSSFEQKMLIKTMVVNNINAKDYYSLV